MRAKRILATGRCVTLAALALTAGCGGGGGGEASPIIGGIGGGGGGSGSGGSWTQGVFPPAAQFQARCENPRSGNDPDGNPWPDRQGSFLDENNFLRSYSDDTYLWYREIVDRDPSLYPDTLAYFDLLKTTATTASGSPKDNFHFTFDTDEWLALSESGVSGGYGAEFVLISASPPREIVVAYTNPGTPAAAAGIVRGTEVLTIDGVDVANGSDVDTLNDGLFPSAPGENHDFEILDPDGTRRTVTLRSELITSQPVLDVRTLPAPNGDVGYLLFNDHIATAEAQLVSAIQELDDLNVTDLVLDLRYNGGGFLAIAAQLSYMIAGPVATNGRTFELLQFNDKYPNTNPVTGEDLDPEPFYPQTLGFSVSAGTSLLSLDLSRVYVITGSGTCSASEAIINGLRGIGVEVIQIGSTTCGKPYGFYGTDNCGTTYFTIQFRGVNDANFGDYADGFIPSPAGTSAGSEVPGCVVGDDFSRALGDVTEDRLSAALTYRATGNCPALATLSDDPERARLRMGPDNPVTLPNQPWRQNRMMVAPR